MFCFKTDIEEGARDREALKSLWGFLFVQRIETRVLDLYNTVTFCFHKNEEEDIRYD
jgi:hypothetical protein